MVTMYLARVDDVACVSLCRALFEDKVLRLRIVESLIISYSLLAVIWMTSIASGAMPGFSPFENT